MNKIYRIAGGGFSKVMKRIGLFCVFSVPILFGIYQYTDNDISFFKTYKTNQQKG